MNGFKWYQIVLISFKTNRKSRTIFLCRESIQYLDNIFGFLLAILQITDTKGCLFSQNSVRLIIHTPFPKKSMYFCPLN